MIRLAVKVLLRIVRSDVDGRPFRITFDANQKVLRSSVPGPLLIDYRIFQAPQRSSAASSVDNSVVKMLQEQVKKLQGEMASLKAELSSVKETAKKNGERVTVLESLVQEETDDEDDKK